MSLSIAPRHKINVTESSVCRCFLINYTDRLCVLFVCVDAFSALSAFSNANSRDHRHFRCFSPFFELKPKTKENTPHTIQNDLGQMDRKHFFNTFWKCSCIVKTLHSNLFGGNRFCVMCC